MRTGDQKGEDNFGSDFMVRRLLGSSGSYWGCYFWLNWAMAPFLKTVESLVKTDARHRGMVMVI